MPKFIDTSGRTKIAIGVCARCNLKFPYSDLVQDPNYPGLYVCPEDRDNFDPYRLPPRRTDDLTLDHPRPDVAINTQAPTPVLYANDLFGITAIGFVRPWQPLTDYAVGCSITPQNIDDPNVDLPQNWWVCIVAGKSGATAPDWPQKPGVILGDVVILVDDAMVNILTSDGSNFNVLVADGNGDGTVCWINMGIFPN